MPKFIFVRHGYSCSNALGNLVHSNIIKASDAKALKSHREVKTIFNSNIKPLDDPVLTHLGVSASTHNGCVINKVFTQVYNINKINIIGCSPLIRAMETAYYMSRKWINPPTKIYVLPFLREIDEGSSDKFSKSSIEKINLSPGYSMKSLQEQKAYLDKLGILNYFDFSFVEGFPEERLLPGDIKLFLNWFANYYLPLVVEPVDDLNIFIVSHAGVLHDFTQTGFVNNSGFIIDTRYTSKFLQSKKLIPRSLALLQPFLDKYNFFKDYTNPAYNQEYYCPSERCGQLCSVVNVKSNNLKTLNLECNISDKLI
jgi:hypothetical protein